jgi:GNAT superfamily N-acetyltransferase
VRDLPPGWATDLAILQQTGSTIDDHGDHLIVRTPANPLFHWGNCVLVMNAGRLDDAAHWTAVFAAAHPGADWISLGLPRLPDETAAWTTLGLTVEEEDVLSTTALPRLLPAPVGYEVRALVSDDDWGQHVARELGEHEPGSHANFVRARTASQRDLVRRGVAAWFGGFAGGTLVADLGIVLCGNRHPTARYQAVGTDAAHRGRGLAGHLLGVAARWAAERDTRQWVIVTQATNPAGRLYRSVGFRPDLGSAQAYRPPPPR